jgi:hypothetical protein
MLDGNYLTELQEWRQQADSNLRAEQSWLALVGLFWFEEGENRFGGHHSNAVHLSMEALSDHIGTFELISEKVILSVEPGISVTVDGEEVTEQELKPDVSGQPSEIRVDSLVMVVVQRGERFGLRVWDQNNPRRKKFPGRIWYEPTGSFQIQAHFSTYDPPKEIPITNILGDTSDAPLAGYVEFALGRQENRLDALEVADDRLYIIFRDLTSKGETYPAGRYLYTEAPQDGTLLLDFNRAYNPPCAFTDFATCPLPPPQNCLPFRIEAGERFVEFTG